jgi:FkbM family methyltransferase
VQAELSKIFKAERGGGGGIYDVNWRSLKFLAEHTIPAARGLVDRLAWNLLAARASYFVRRKFKPFTIFDYRVENAQQLICWFELFWEGTLFRGWPLMMPRRPTILDIGANYGVFGYIARQRFPGAKIIGFEAHPELAKYCRELGCYDGVFEVALADQKGAGTLFMDRTEGGFTGNIGDSRQFIYGSERVSVAMERLDEFRIASDFVKLDVDGSELLVLAGGRKTLRQAGALTVECGDRWRALSVALQTGKQYRRIGAMDYLFWK